MTNKERVAKATKAFNTYARLNGGKANDFEEHLTDLVTDLLHLAHSKNVNISHLVDRSWGHFSHEHEGEVKRA